MNYSVNDLKELIQYARKSGIVQFELGELKFYFGSEFSPARRRRRGKEDEQLDKERLLQKNKQITEEQLANLRLEDPVAYEEAMLNGELTKDGTDE